MSAQTIQSDKNLTGKSKILVARSKSKDIAAHVAGLNVVIEVMPELHHQCIYLVLLPNSTLIERNITNYLTSKLVTYMVHYRHLFCSAET